jgi:hypothetical protein
LVVRADPPLCRTLTHRRHQKYGQGNAEHELSDAAGDRRGSAEAKDFEEQKVCVPRECIEALGSFQEPTIEELAGGTRR